MTTVRHTLRNGTRLEQSTTARYYRDSAGRVRVELLMEGVRPPKTASEQHMRLMVYPMADVYPNVAEPKVFTLDEVTRTARGAAGSLTPLSNGGGAILGVPVGGVRFVTFRRAVDWARREPELIRGAELLRERITRGSAVTFYPARAIFTRRREIACAPRLLLNKTNLESSRLWWVQKPR